MNEKTNNKIKTIILRQLFFWYSDLDGQGWKAMWMLPTQALPVRRPSASDSSALRTASSSMSSLLR